MSHQIKLILDERLLGEKTRNRTLEFGLLLVPLAGKYCRGVSRQILNIIISIYICNLFFV